jgi:hypothetical protein
MAQSRVMEQSRIPQPGRGTGDAGELYDPMIREHFERDGWALVQRFLTPREVESLRAATERLASKGASLLADAEIDGARYQVQSASGRRGEAAVRPGALRKITFAWPGIGVTASVPGRDR